MTSRLPRRLKLGCGGVLALVILLLAIAVAIAFYQGRKEPEGVPEYVALGSSFAAGAGLGNRSANSPVLCARSDAGYPSLLAKKLGLSLVDMSCGGATTNHVLAGGQFFQREQIRAIDQRTRLVTLTVGGNDIAYVGDISMEAARRDDTLVGFLTRHLWSGPRDPAERNFSRLKSTLVGIIEEVHRRAPQATVVVVTYPRLLPSSGTCDAIKLDRKEVASMAKVGDDLASVTQVAAREAGAETVDMHALSRGHDACSDEAWVNGWGKLAAAPFHPNARGAEATAEAIAIAFRNVQLKGRQKPDRR